MSLKCNCCIICMPSIASCVLAVRRYEYITVYRAMRISIEEHWMNSCHHRLSFNSHNMCYYVYRPPTTLRKSNVFSCVCLLVQVEADLFKCVHLGVATTLTHLSTWGARPWPLVMLKLVNPGRRAVGLHLKVPLVSQTNNVTQCRKNKRINICVIIVIICGPLVMLKFVYLEKRAVGLWLKGLLVSHSDNVTQCRKNKCINFFVIIMLFHIRGTWCSDPVSMGTTVKFFQFA